jgi:hypothetical protein
LGVRVSGRVSAPSIGQTVSGAAVRDPSVSPFSPVIPFAARRTLEVGDRDIEGLDIALPPTAEISGTLTFDRACPEGSVDLYDWLDSRFLPGNDNHKISLSGAGTFVFEIPGAAGPLDITVTCPPNGGRK